MEIILTRVFNSLDVVYIFSCVFATYLLIKFVLPNKLSEGKTKLVSAIIVILMGVVFHLVEETKISVLILSGLTVVTVYEWLIKPLLKAFGIEYKASDPELLKPKDNAK